VIPAPPGIHAEYLIKREDGKTRITSRAVIAFNDDGEPLVAGRQNLVTASAYGKYELEDFGDGGYTAVIPGGGWCVEWPGGNSGPLIGWACKPGGRIVALDADQHGLVEDSDDWIGEYRIYHPDAEEASSGDS
jgi:hypothetical protein